MKDELFKLEMEFIWADVGLQQIRCYFCEFWKADSTLMQTVFEVLFHCRIEAKACLLNICHFTEILGNLTNQHGWHVIQASIQQMFYNNRIKSRCALVNLWISLEYFDQEVSFNFDWTLYDCFFHFVIEWFLAITCYSKWIHYLWKLFIIKSISSFK